jgi:hypothetical protein
MLFLMTRVAENLRNIPRVQTEDIVVMLGIGYGSVKSPPGTWADCRGTYAHRLVDICAHGRISSERLLILQ